MSVCGGLGGIFVLFTSTFNKAEILPLIFHIIKIIISQIKSYFMWFLCFSRFFLSQEQQFKGGKSGVKSAWLTCRVFPPRRKMQACFRLILSLLAFKKSKRMSDARWHVCMYACMPSLRWVRAAVHECKMSSRVMCACPRGGMKSLTDYLCRFGLEEKYGLNDAHLHIRGTFTCAFEAFSKEHNSTEDTR